MLSLQTKVYILDLGGFFVIESYIFIVLDTCNGDSGGPLMAFTTSNQWILVGVTSYGIGCARSDKAGIYTRIAALQTWFKSNTSNQFTYPISSSLVKATTVATGRFLSSMSGPVHVPARNMLHFSYQ